MIEYNHYYTMIHHLLSNILESHQHSLVYGLKIFVTFPAYISQVILVCFSCASISFKPKRREAVLSKTLPLQNASWYRLPFHRVAHTIL